MMNCFHAGDVLIPEKISMKKWACVACDQFSSQMDYWERVKNFVADEPSTYNLIFPEALLRTVDEDQRLTSIHTTMEKYLSEGVFRTYRRCYVYLERTLENGKVRRGLMGQIDLDEYDFTPGSPAHIRATEGTVMDRLPPRMKLLEHAALEFPHVLLLCDDKRDMILSAAKSVTGEKVYDFDLMEDGGHITGYVIGGLGVGVVNSAISDYIAATEAGQKPGNSMSFAVGDGNHSLASAKACWEKLKPTLSGDDLINHPARYALVELENIHDEAIEFEPIHRVVKDCDVSQLVYALKSIAVSDGYPLTVITEAGEEILYLDKKASPLAVAILQPFLDEYLSKHDGRIDYIHGDDVTRTLGAQPGSVGIIVPGMDKNSLFPGVLQGGVLPRKTFSMGHAKEKRYYLEGKKRR